MSSWFETARFGMFVHWGHPSQRGVADGGWMRSRRRQIVASETSVPYT